MPFFITGSTDRFERAVDALVELEKRRTELGPAAEVRHTDEPTIPVTVWSIDQTSFAEWVRSTQEV